MKTLRFETSTYPPRRYAVQVVDYSLGLGREPLDRLESAIELVKVPNFFPDDYTTQRLFCAIASAADAVDRDTMYRPICVELGRFTFLETIAGIENRWGEGSLTDFSFEDGVVTALGTRLRLAPGLDHFIRPVPNVMWTMAHGTRDDWFVTPVDIYRAAEDAVAKATRSVPPKG